MNGNRVLSIALLLLLIVAGVAAGAGHAASAAQTPANGAYLTWSTNTYTPPFFGGKKLPTAGSPVTAWVVLFENGQAADLSQDTVYWYFGSDLLQSGVGDQKITFAAPTQTENVTNLRVNIQDPTGQLWTATIQVPVVNPTAAIETDYPGGVFNTPPAVADALPYFFNVTDPSSLVYSWTVDGMTAQANENPQEVDVSLGSNTPSGTTLDVQLNVTDPSSGDSANASTNIIYQAL